MDETRDHCLSVLGIYVLGINKSHVTKLIWACSWAPTSWGLRYSFTTLAHMQPKTSSFLEFILPFLVYNYSCCQNFDSDPQIHLQEVDFQNMTIPSFNLALYLKALFVYTLKCISRDKCVYILPRNFLHLSFAYDK